LLKNEERQWTTREKEPGTFWGPVLDFDLKTAPKLLNASILSAQGYPPHSYVIENRLGHTVEKTIAS
jgi:hypothetical protein